MDKKSKSKSSEKVNKGKLPKKSFFSDERIRFIAGIVICGVTVYILVACISYLFWWTTDTSLPNSSVLSSSDTEVRNWSGKSGHFIAKQLISYGFGFGAFFVPMIFGTIGLKLLNFPKLKVGQLILKFALAAILSSLILSFIFGTAGGFLISGPGGAQGYSIVKWLNSFIGKIGDGIFLLALTISYLILALKVSPSSFAIWRSMRFRRSKGEDLDGEKEVSPDDEDTDDKGVDDDDNDEVEDDDEEPFVITDTTSTTSEPIINVIDQPYNSSDGEELGVTDEDQDDNEKVEISITKPVADDVLSASEVDGLLEAYDPLLDLSHYKFPPVSLLRDYKSDNSYDSKEVIENKNTITKTLADFKITIKQISATVGPTVTLFEIIPDRGVRLAKIKALEDDIALSLSALGVRIIAPIPGRGTVGIEVPKKKPETVAMRSLISSKAFQETKFDIPLALGRTITNEPFIVDLTKMPHLLVAGATGQGKSVGINAIIASIIYKKHPAEIKFVLIDPKRVELSLYTKIERHFLAKLPGEEDAIITDTQKVINTLNSLCIEMDRRLELLKDAHVRNIKEYNEKFVERKLNPQKGHKYLPYIVLIIDEFADLIMTAGREIESPIGRLAQLARAIGIHLIISTQRPSANIITGFIKANFPTRIAFRVFSSIDSRTILDATGADKLVGRGDMLVSSGKEPIRVQCAFIDTDEIEEIAEFIGSQQGYPDAMLLPEYVNDNQNETAEVDLKKRDPLFDDAARLVVQHQQGSTSLIQRKLSLGYNRAGRIVDQLEAAGILGPFEGSKAREVLCNDPIALEQILKSLD